MTALWQKKQQRQGKPWSLTELGVPLLHGIGYNAHQVCPYHWVFKPNATCELRLVFRDHNGDVESARKVLRQVSDLYLAALQERRTEELPCAA